MTTAAQSTSVGTSPGSLGAEVRRPLAVTLVVGAVAAVTGALVDGSPGLFGSLVGAGMVLAFFAPGAMVLGVVAARAPSASLLVALMTYTLQVVLIGAVFAGLSRSDLLGTSLDRHWVAGTVIAATLGWLTAVVRSGLTARIPAFDVSPSGSSRPTEAGAR